jgi:hypothetical protein
MFKCIYGILVGFGAIFLTSLVTGEESVKKETKSVRSLIMPKTVVSDYLRDSELAVFGATDGILRKPILVDEKAVIEVTDDDSFLLEIEDRDEESWSISVLNAWKINTATRPILESFDVREFNKSELTISGMPQNVSFASFFQMSSSGVRDWVCIYQAVLNGTLNDNLFSIGSWICVPLDGAGNQVATPRIIHIAKTKVAHSFDDLPKVDESLEDAIKKIRLYQPKKDHAADPFFGQKVEGKDPFE